VFDQREYGKAHYAKHRDEYIERARKRYRANTASKKAYDAARRVLKAKELADYESRKRKRAPEYRMWQAAKQRAKKKGLPFNIEPSDIVVPSHCPALGIPLSFSKGRAADCSPSLDRLVPSLGYVKGNIAVISKRANSIKGNANAREVRAVADWLAHFEVPA